MLSLLSLFTSSSVSSTLVAHSVGTYLHVYVRNGGKEGSKEMVEREGERRER